MCDNRLRIEALAFRQQPLVLVRAHCPEHGMSAFNIAVEGLVYLLALNGLKDIRENGRLRHG